MTPEQEHGGRPGEAHVPEGLVRSVVDLVETGPVHLGAYTLAELTAVDAVVDFLQERPSDEALGEAVRSLAARQLLVPGSSSQQVRVRGDLGIAVALQQRASVVLDARVTGTDPGEPWRVLLLPQPEGVTLDLRIDALGVHEVSVRSTAETAAHLGEWLPRGDLEQPEAGTDPRAVLTSAERSALVTVTTYTSEGTAEREGRSADLALAQHGERLYAFVRDAGDRGRLVPAPRGRDLRELVTDMLPPGLVPER
jgi:hypothetical protein